MSNRMLKTLTLLALAGACATALADDPPSLVGRVALAQGQVSIGGGAGEPGAAQVNWPVTADETITTARGARTELQVGSAFIRLDGDSSLEVLELDEDNLKLRLDYGSASIRVADRAMLGGFELSTPEGRVRMQEPGWVRVDTGRIADTSSVSVFEGVALVEGGGASLTVRAGKRADLQPDDVRTVAASRDGFDDWSQARDRAVQAPAATRYVSTDVTGYADLDRYGSWRTDPQYGPLWTPSAVGANWTPYSDGSWVWFEPWGWTWVDNAPWGYAPFHYGRWVVVNRRWCWAPGRREHRAVWAPALVGWVGGAGWSTRFNLNNRHQALPARGWYPLSPRERFVPAYRLSDDRLRRLNSDVRPDFRRRWDEHRPAGLTVVPQEQFSQHGRVVVPKVPRAAVPAQALNTAPSAVPPAPPPAAHERNWRREQHRGEDRDRTDRAEWGRDRMVERDRGGRRGDERVPGPVATSQVLTAQPAQTGFEHHPMPPAGVAPGLAAQPARTVVPEHRQPPQPVAAASMPPAPAGQPQPPQPVVPEHRAPPQPVTVLSAPPALPGQQALPPRRLPWRMEHRERADDRAHELSAAPGPVPAGVAPAPLQGAPAERVERPRRTEGDVERRREMAQPAPVHMPAPAPAPLHVPAPGQPPVHAPPPMPASQPAPQPAVRPAPAPAQPEARPSAAAAASAPARGPGRHGDGNPHQYER